MKDLKIMKTIKGRIKLVAATASLVTGLSFIGCEATVTPDGQVVVDGQVVTQLPDTTDPVDTPEVVEPEVVEPEVVEEIPMPDFVLYDENGEVYEPRHVTLDDMYERIDYANEKYEWKSDWDRDRYISFLLNYNALYMNKEDIETIYNDYLDNFGLNVLDDELYVAHFTDRDDEWRSVIDFEDCFIDEKVAEEARRYDYWYFKADDETKKDELVSKFSDYYFNSMDYTNSKIHTVLLDDAFANILSLEVEDERIYDFSHYNCAERDTIHIFADKNLKINHDYLEYEIDGYESSHIEEMTK